MPGNQGKHVLIAKIFEDPTPGGVIGGRFIEGLLRLVGPTDLTPQERMGLCEDVMAVGRKLSMVWGHCDGYTKEEDRLIQHLRGGVSGTGCEVSQALMQHAEEFLVQAKSCLDCLMKVPVRVLKPKRWGILTFKGSGAGVARAIRGSVPKEMGEQAEEIAKFIEANVPWFKPMIDARDEANHPMMGGMDFRHFMVEVRMEKGTQEVRVPMWDQRLSWKDFLHVAWVSVFLFCERLAGMFLGLRIIGPGSIGFRYTVKPLTDPSSPWELV